MAWDVVHKIFLRFQDIDKRWTSRSLLFLGEGSEEHPGPE